MVTGMTSGSTRVESRNSAPVLRRGEYVRAPTLPSGSAERACAGPERLSGSPKHVDLRYVDNCCQHQQTEYMSRNTMSFALPENMREYIDARVSDGSYGNTSEYLRELIRRDQREQAAQRLRDLIADGLASGEGREATDDVISEIRERALGTEA